MATKSFVISPNQIRLADCRRRLDLGKRFGALRQSKPANPRANRARTHQCDPPPGIGHGADFLGQMVDSVQVEGQPVSALKNFAFDTADLLGNGSSQTLTKVLEKSRQRQLLIAKSNSDVKIDPKVLIVADQRVPYSTVKAVLASAALQGYTDFKLAVVKGE